jgi:hypothetical protein
MDGVNTQSVSTISSLRDTRYRIPAMPLNKMGPALFSLGGQAFSRERWPRSWPRPGVCIPTTWRRSGVRHSGAAPAPVPRHAGRGHRQRLPRATGSARHCPAGRRCNPVQWLTSELIVIAASLKGDMACPVLSAVTCPLLATALRLHHRLRRKIVRRRIVHRHGRR